MIVRKPSEALSLVSDTEYFRVEMSPRESILWLRRTNVPFASAAAAEQAQAAVLERLTLLPLRHLRLLVDLRTAPARNDPEFEDVVKRFRRDLFALLPRWAVLVSTATGKMQMTRHVRSDGGSPNIFDDEDAALAHLRAL